MKENNNGENSQVEILVLEKQIKKTQFYTAIVVLIGALVTTSATWWTVKTGIESLREKEKPLEGIWDYNSNYTKWHLISKLLQIALLWPLYCGIQCPYLENRVFF